MYSVNRFQETPGLIDIDDLKIILEKLDDEKKLLLIQYFVPRLSYEEAIEL
jgi:hypothetical protein